MGLVPCLRSWLSSVRGRTVHREIVMILRHAPKCVCAFFVICEERSDEAIQLTLLRYGLLRGACHRARVRATRWLAMTIRTSSRRADLEQLAVVAGFQRNPQLAAAIQPGHHRHHGHHRLAPGVVEAA